MATTGRGKSTETSTPEQNDVGIPFDDPQGGYPESDYRQQGDYIPYERPHGEPERPARRREAPLAALIGDPQVQRRARRGVVAVVLGVLFTIVFDIRLGVLAAIVVVAVDVI